MKNTKLIILFIILSSIGLLGQDANYEGSIIVKITNFKSNQGEVKIALFNSKVLRNIRVGSFKKIL